MERVLPSKIEAVMLFDSYSGFSSRELMALINELAAGYDHTFIRTQLENSPGYLNYSSNGLMIEITHAEGPLAPDGFAATLASGYTQLSFPNAGRIVQSHGKYVHMAITHCGTTRDDPNGHIPPQTPAGPFSEEQFLLSVQLLKNLILIYASRSHPMAIHWMQSNKLLTLKQFAPFAMEGKDVSLLVHPSFYSSGNDENGNELIGLRTFGAANLIGREIVFEEAPVDADTMFERTLQFILRTQETGWYIPDGDTFGLDEKEIIRVHHADDPHDENGVLKLVYEYSEAFGFDFSEPEVEDEDEPLNMDDPVERALQEKLDELKASQKAAQETADASESETDANSAVLQEQPMEPWSGSGKKADMTALRALAKSSAHLAAETTAETSVSQEAHFQSPRAAESATQAPEMETPVADTAPNAKGEETERPPEAEASTQKQKALLSKVSGLFSKG